MKRLVPAACAVVPVLVVTAAGVFGTKGLSAAAENRARAAAMRHISASQKAARSELEKKEAEDLSSRTEKPAQSAPAGSAAESTPPVSSAVPDQSRETSAPSASGTKKAVQRAENGRLPVKNIQQLPEMKAGCEVTSAAIVLNYLGCDVTKTELARYLKTDRGFKTVNGKLYGPDPWAVFAGSPDDKYGCYAPVVTDMSNRYLRETKSNLTAVDISGAVPLELYACIDEGYPVIVWATTNMQEPSIGPEWYLNDTGEYYQWLLKEHCLVLIGYDDHNVVFSDPLDARGTVTYDRSLFELRYAQMYSQAVLVQ